jgi:hypothetical protein
MYRIIRSSTMQAPMPDHRRHRHDLYIKRSFMCSITNAWKCRTSSGTLTAGPFSCPTPPTPWPIPCLARGVGSWHGGPIVKRCRFVQDCSRHLSWRSETSPLCHSCMQSHEGTWWNYLAWCSCIETGNRDIFGLPLQQTSARNYEASFMHLYGTESGILGFKFV